VSYAEPPTGEPDRPLTRIPFSPRAEANIRALAGWMQVAAVVSIVAGIVKAVSAFVPRYQPGHIVDAIVSLLIGVWIYQAGTAFRRVATTDVADQQFLMDGFTQLRKVFLLQSVLIIITLAFVVIALTVAAVTAVSHSPRV
jgi:Family of unknown function (DUF5362)